MRTPAMAPRLVPLSGPVSRPVAGRRTMTALRVGAGLALLTAGAVHLQQDVAAGFIHVHVVGVLFMLNFIGATVIGLALLAPLERLLGRWSGLAIDALAAGGLAICLGSIGSILWAENRSFFGFRELGYRAPVVVAIASEAAATILLISLVVVRRARSATGG